MAKNDNPVTLEMTWGAAQAAARKHNCSIQELTNNQVREHISHGSDGCVAAFLRQVKIQELDTKAFDAVNFGLTHLDELWKHWPSKQTSLKTRKRNK